MSKAHVPGMSGCGLWAEVMMGMVLGTMYIAPCPFPVGTVPLLCFLAKQQCSATIFCHYISALEPGNHESPETMS